MNSMWAVKIAADAKTANIMSRVLALSMEDTPDGKQSQVLAARRNRIAMVDPANGNANADVCWRRAIRYS